MEDENSLLFSLKELENLERDRVLAERNAEEARRRNAERARVEAAARRACEIEEVRAEAERVRREEAARETAMARAEMERVRAEVAARAEAERDGARRRHELELTERRAAIARGRHRWITTASLIATLASAAFAAFLSSGLRGAEQALQDRSAALERERDAHRRSMSDLVSASARVRELEARLAALRPSPNPRTPPSASPVPKSPGHRGATAPGRPRPAAPCSGADGDPLNGCLQ